MADPIGYESQANRRQASYLTIKRATRILMLAAVFSVWLGENYKLELFSMMMTLAAGGSALDAMFSNEKFCGAAINRWDQAVMFFGIGRFVEALFTLGKGSP